MLTNRPFRIPSISLFHLSILHSSFFLSSFLLPSWINRPALRSTLILFFFFFYLFNSLSNAAGLRLLQPPPYRPVAVDPLLSAPIHLSCIADGPPRVDSSCLKSEQFVLSGDFHKFLVNSEKRHIIYNDPRSTSLSAQSTFRGPRSCSPPIQRHLTTVGCQSHGRKQSHSPLRSHKPLGALAVVVSWCRCSTLDDVLGAFTDFARLGYAILRIYTPSHILSYSLTARSVQPSRHVRHDTQLAQ